jgi:hypothetical protein
VVLDLGHGAGAAVTDERREVPIKRLIQEVPPDKAVNRGTVANPDVGQGPGIVPFWCEMTGSG